MSWYDNNWDYRQKVTVDHTKVGADLTDFAVYVDLSNMKSGFFSNVLSDGADIRVTKSDGTTEVAREVVSVDTNGNTGELHFKAAGTLSSSSDTEFYIYYGNSGATGYSETATYGKHNVWNSDFKTRHGLTNTTDSTSNNHDASKNGGITVGGASGKVGDATDFDGNDDYLELGGGGSLGDFQGTLTFSVWINLDTTPGDRYYVMGFREANSYWQAIKIQSDGKAQFFIKDGSNGESAVSTTALDDGNWHNIVATADKNGNLKIYIDGTQEDSFGISLGTYTSNNNFAIGEKQYNHQYQFDGRIDEARVLSKEATSGWVKTQNNNQNSPSTFYTVGSQESQSTSVSVDVSTQTINLTPQDETVRLPKTVDISSPVDLTLSAQDETVTGDAAPTVGPATLTLTPLDEAVATAADITVNESVVNASVGANSVSVSGESYHDEGANPQKLSITANSPTVDTEQNVTVNASVQTLTASPQDETASGDANVSTSTQTLSTDPLSVTVSTVRPVDVTVGPVELTLDTPQHFSLADFWSDKDPEYDDGAFWDVKDPRY